MLNSKRKIGDMFFWHSENPKNQDIHVSKNYHSKIMEIDRLLYYLGLEIKSLGTTVAIGGGCTQCKTKCFKVKVSILQCRNTLTSKSLVIKIDLSKSTKVLAYT